MNLNNNLTQIILAILALIAAVGITIKITNTRKSKKTRDTDNSVTISDNDVGGDVAGRDVNKR